MSLRTIGAVAAAALVAIFSLLSWPYLSRLWDVREERRAVQASAAAIDALLEGAIEQSLERSASQLALRQPGPIAPAFRQIIDGQRSKSDGAYDRLVAGMPAVLRADSGVQRFLVDFARARAEIASLRRRIDAEVAKPLTERDQAATRELPLAKVAVVERIADMADRLFDADARVPVMMKVEMLMQRLAWEVREFGGQERTYFAHAILAREPMTQATLDRMATLDRRTVGALERIETTVAAVTLDPALREGIAQLLRVYRGAYAAERERLRGLAASGAYQTTFERFFGDSSAALGLAEQVRRDFGATIAERTQRYVTRQEAALAWGAGIVAVALVVLAGLLWGFLAMIVAPVRRLAADVAKTARGETDVVIAGTTRKDEVGDMARAVEVFRQNAEKLAAAEGERAALEARANASRAEIEDRLIAAVGTIVDAAKMGDFSVKAEASAALGRLSALVEGLNAVTSACEGFLDEADRSLGALASGDLSARMSEDFEGRLAAVATNFNRAVGTLAGTITEVARAAKATRHAAGEIGGATRELSGRTESQAAALEETSAAIEEISKTASGTAQTVDKAAGTARATAARAKAGAETATAAVAAIDRVDAQAKKVVEIVGVMDGLAFQTNLLALNASVEAARAGDAGRGFAVVANEVRRLAQQSAEAARDVRLLITETNAQVDQGVKLVKAAGDSLGAIVADVEGLAGTFSEVAVAAREQSTGVAEVARSLEQMDAMTQANAAAAEETAGAARGLVDTAETLTMATGRFTLAEAAAPRANRKAA